MIKFHNTISIQAPLGKTFDFLADFEKLPHWNYYIQRVEKITPGAPPLGARYHQIRKHDEQTFEVTQFEVGKIIEIQTLPGAKLRVKRVITFSRDEDYTQLEDYFELDTWHPAFLQRLFTGKIRRAVKQNLDKLKTLLETGQVTLQDGRTISNPTPDSHQD